MTEADHIWQVLNLRYGSDLQAATVTLLLKDGDKAVRFVTITIPQTGSDLPTTGWRKRQIALDIKANNARELGLDYEPEKTTMEMAREAGFDWSGKELTWENVICTEELEAFAAMVREDEREKLQLAAECYRMRKHKGVCNEKTKSNEAN
jgi:hypothetical protein